MQVMRLLGEAVVLVDQGRVDEAAKLVLDATGDEAIDIAEVLHDIAQDWDQSMVESFDTHGKNYLIDGRWGRFWLVPALPRRKLLPPAPMLVPKHIRTLARAVAS